MQFLMLKNYLKVSSKDKEVDAHEEEEEEREEKDEGKEKEREKVELLRLEVALPKPKEVVLLAIEVVLLGLQEVAMLESIHLLSLQELSMLEMALMEMVLLLCARQKEENVAEAHNRKYKAAKNVLPEGSIDEFLLPGEKVKKKVLIDLYDNCTEPVGPTLYAEGMSHLDIFEHFSSMKWSI